MRSDTIREKEGQNLPTRSIYLETDSTSMIAVKFLGFSDPRNILFTAVSKESSSRS